jgi:endoglucanase
VDSAAARRAVGLRKCVRAACTIAVTSAAGAFGGCGTSTGAGNPAAGSASETSSGASSPSEGSGSSSSGPTHDATDIAPDAEGAPGPTDATFDGRTRDAAPTDAGSVEAAGDAATAIAVPSSFHCVNWADQRDNFVNGLLQPSGLDSATDTYATVQTKAGAILSGFETVLGANAIRVPINEPTVAGSWWSAYKGLIDAAVAKGMRVIVAYWAWQNGKPDSTSAYDSMWQAVVRDYASNNLVFFDIHNEPFGFSTTDWIQFAATWVGSFPDVPRSRIIIAGSGYDQNVVPVAADSRLAGCLLSLHVYTFFVSTTMTTQGWQSAVASSIGTNAGRTIATEWGAPMTTKVAYDGTGAGSNDQAYMAGIPNELRTLGMGSCYWPGLRIGDAWSMTTMTGTGANIALSVTNTSGLDRVHWAWGL